MKHNGKVFVLIFTLMAVFISSDSYVEDFRMYMVYSPKTIQTPIITYDAERTKESDVDMYVAFFKGGSTKLAWAATNAKAIFVWVPNKIRWGSVYFAFYFLTPTARCV